MPRRAAPAALLGAAGLADLAGAHTLAFYVLFITVPVAAAAALATFGALVDARRETAEETALGARAAFSTLALALTVFAGALHASAEFGASMPAAATPVLVAALAAAALATVG